ncbi:MAG: tetratricopeptide repeat protein [Phycisphaerae bacterium]|jgi:tetratricopeptide (TPR) repeat protein
MGDEPTELGQAKSEILSLIQGNNFAEAEAEIQQFIVDFPKDESAAKTLDNIAQQYQMAEQYDKAIELSQYVLGNYPWTDWSVWLQMRLVVCNILLGKDSLAQENIKKLTSEYSNDPNLPKTLYILAEQYRLSWRYEEAKELYQLIIEQHPDSLYADKAEFGLLTTKTAQAGLSLIESGNGEKAQDSVEDLAVDFEDKSELAMVFNNFALRYEELDKYAEAKKLYQEIIWRWPDSLEAERAPLDVQRMDILSFVQAEDANYANVLFDKFVADFNGNPHLASSMVLTAEGWYRKAFKLADEGSDAQSEKYYRKAIDISGAMAEKFPGSREVPNAYYLICQCYHDLGEYEKILPYLQKILDGWPDFKYAWSVPAWIGECYENLRNSGKMPESEANPKIKQAYRMLIEKYPDCSLVGHACLKLARLSSKENRPTDEVVYLELFMEKRPSDPRVPRVMFKLGRTYEEMGQLDLAWGTYVRFIERDPNHPLVETLWNKLEKLAGSTPSTGSGRTSSLQKGVEK